MNQAQLIEQATLAAIVAVQQSIEATQRLLDKLNAMVKELDRTDPEYIRIQKQYKSVNDSMHRQRLDLLELTGEIPPRKPKKLRNNMRNQWASSAR
jgi:hypothetical protein